MKSPDFKLRGKLLAVAVAVLFVISMAAGCNSNPPAATTAAATTAAATTAAATTAAATTAETTTAAATATATASADPLQPTYSASMYSDALTIDCYSDGGTYNGLQPDGWFSKIVQDTFNMKINIIGGQSAAGDTIFQTRSAAGTLGDLIFTSNQHLSDSIKAGNLILDITDLYNTKITAYSAQFSAAEKNLQTYLKTDKVYGLPTVVSSQSPLSPNTDGANPQNGSYMRLDAYIAAGAPAMNTLDDLLPTLQQMVAKTPKTDAGKPTYAFSLFKDWDGGGAMFCAAALAGSYGWTRSGSVGYYNPSTGETQSYLDENGYYKKALELYFKANQLGLLDPDSATQDWNTISSDKFGKGQIMYSWFSWLGIPGFNSPANVAAGKGYAYVPIADQKIYCDGVSPYGGGAAIAIGQGAKDPGRLADFINWMSSPMGFMTMYDGPEGLAWKLDSNNKPVLTDLGKAGLAGGLGAAPGPDVSAQYGGGQFVTGAPQIGTMILMWRGKEMNPVLNCPYDSRLWDSTLTTGATALDKSWQTAFKANSVLDYLTGKNMLVVSSPSSYIAAPLTTDQNTMAQQVSQEIVNDSWKIIFAKNQAQFDKLWADMVTNAKGLGADDLLKLDTQQHTDMAAAQKQFVDQYNASHSGK